MKIEALVLQGKYVRLEPLDLHHVEGLVTASAVAPPSIGGVRSHKARSRLPNMLRRRWRGKKLAARCPSPSFAMKMPSSLVRRASGISNPGPGRQVIPCTIARLRMPARSAIHG